MEFGIILEWLGVIAAIIYVLLASIGNRYCFVFGLISSVIFVQICYSSRLYFETVINIYYVIMSFVGWYTWKSVSGEIDIVKMNNRSFFGLLIISVLMALLLGFIVEEHTNADLPYLDAITTVLAVLATWMMVKKQLENWIVWIIADGLSIFMYSSKDHIPLSILFGIYSALAIYGYFNWKKKMIPA